MNTAVFQDAYAELVKLAVERRARLEESRKLWQFYWDMADEENWIKEKEHILSTGDIGHDLTTIHLLISKHKALEEDDLRCKRMDGALLVNYKDAADIKTFLKGAIST